MGYAWLRSSNLPSWLTAAGTIAIAVVAFFTLDPVIENLNLREKNKVLEDELIDVQNQINQANQTLEITKTEADSVKKSLDIAQQVLRSLNEQNARLDSANEKLIKNLKTREEERLELKQQIQHLNQESTSLQSENATFKAHNEKLSNQMTSIRNKLDELVSQLSETKKAQRSYVIESIILKAKAILPESLPAGIKLGVYGSLSGYEILSEADPFYNVFFKTQSYQNGVDLVKSLYNSREFDLLSEVDARKLRIEITNFMDKHQIVFREPIIEDSEIKNRFNNHLLAKFKKSKNMLSSEEAKKLEEEYKKELKRAEEAINNQKMHLMKC